MSISAATVAELRSRWTTSLPNGWHFTKFGEVLRAVKRPVDILDDEEYDQPVIRRGHAGIEIRDRQLGKDIKTKAQFQIRAGDWLMSKVQILHGAYGIVPPALDGAIASGTYFAFRPEPALDLRYLWYLSHLRQFHDSCAVASVGVVIEKMVFRAEDWKRLEFPLPPLPEQKKIAAILSSVDEAIQATQAVIDQTRRVKEGLLQDLLTRGIGHTRFKQTEIGEIPEGWEVRKLEDILADVEPAMRSGPFGSALLKSELTESGIPVLGIDNVHVERFVADFRRFITPEKFDSLRRYAVRADDVMITIMGTVGRCCLVPANIGTAISSKHTWTLTIDQGKYRPYLLCAQLNYAPWVLEHFEADAQGGMMDAIRSETLRGVLLPVPPLAEQMRIEQVMKQVDSQRDNHLLSLARLQAVKSGLLTDLLTGKVRVTP